MIFLRFPDEQTYLDTVAPYMNDEGNITLPNIDVIGLIYEGGEYDDEGNAITPPTPVEGYHVNVLEHLTEFEKFTIAVPSHPHRVFLGVPYTTAPTTETTETTEV